MCSTVMRVINHAACSPEFRAWTRARLGVEPAPRSLEIDAPDLPGKTAVAVTIPLNMRELPAHARFASRVCVVRTWNPEVTVRPVAVERMDVAWLDAAEILRLPGETLLAVDFPRQAG